MAAPGGSRSTGLQRPNTVKFKIDIDNDNRKENYVNVARAVGTQFGRDIVACLQPINRNSYLLTFKGPALVRTAIDQGLKYQNQVFEIEAVEDPMVVLTISDAPFELADIAITSALAPYGETKSITYVKNSEELGGFCNGDRRVLFRMKTAVPNFLRAGRFQLTVKYRGQERVCRRCGDPEHFVAACPREIRCSNCGINGHTVDTCFRCVNCKKPGHTEEACPLLRQQNTRDWSALEENADVLKDVTATETAVQLTSNDTSFRAKERVEPNPSVDGEPSESNLVEISGQAEKDTQVVIMDVFSHTPEMSPVETSAIRPPLFSEIVKQGNLSRSSSVVSLEKDLAVSSDSEDGASASSESYNTAASPSGSVKSNSVKSKHYIKRMLQVDKEKFTKPESQLVLLHSQEKKKRKMGSAKTKDSAENLSGSNETGRALKKKKEEAN